MYISMTDFLITMTWGEEDTRTAKEIEYEECKEYDLELYEKESLAEIEHLVELEEYKEPKVVQEHLAFLEHIYMKISSIRVEEIKEGFAAPELDIAISKINLLSKKLMRILYFLDTDLNFSATLPTHRFKYA